MTAIRSAPGGAAASFNDDDSIPITRSPHTANTNNLYLTRAVMKAYLDTLYDATGAAAAAAAASQPLDSDLTAIAALTTSAAGRSLLVGSKFKGYIRGLELSYVSGSAFDVGTGFAHIEGLDAIVEVAATVSKTALTSTASTFHYAYLYAPDLVTTPTVVYSTTAPAAPYHGTARSASAAIGGNAANLHRFIGVMLADAAGTPAIRPFKHHWPSGEFIYLKPIETGTAWSRVLANGKAVTPTDVDCSAHVPPVSTEAIFIAWNGSTAFNVFFGPRGYVAAPPNYSAQNEIAYVAAAGAFAQVVCPCMLDSSRFLQYSFVGAPGTNGCWLDIKAFFFAR